MAATESATSDNAEIIVGPLSTEFFLDLSIFLRENSFKDNPDVRAVLHEKLTNYLQTVGEPLTKEKLKIISSAFNKLRDESPNDPTWNVIIGAIMHEDILNIVSDKSGFFRQDHLSKSLLISQESALRGKGGEAIEDIKVIFETAFCDDEVREKYKRLKELDSIERSLRNTFLTMFFMVDQQALVEKVNALVRGGKQQEADNLMALLSSKILEKDNVEEYRHGIDEFRVIPTDMCIAFAKVAANAVEPKLGMAEEKEVEEEIAHQKEGSLCDLFIEHFENMPSKEKIICGVALGIVAVTALAALFVFCPSGCCCCNDWNQNSSRSCWIL